MPTFLSDPTLAAYLTLLVVALAGVGVWLRNRTRRAAVFAAVAVGLSLALFGLDRAFESPREECVRKIGTMARGANGRNLPDIGAHVSDKFEAAGRNKDRLLADAWNAVVSRGATFHFKDFDRDNFEELPGGRLKIGFVAQVTVPERDIIPFYVEAEFVKEADGAYRMQTFKVYDYVTRTKGGEQTLPRP